MSNNCFVNTLKGTVTDELLPEVGYTTLAELEGTNVELDSDNIRLYNSSGTLKLLGDAYFLNNGTNVGKSISGPSNWSTIKLHITSGKVKITAKSNDIQSYFVLRNSDTLPDVVKYMNIEDTLLAAKNTPPSIQLGADMMSGNLENVLNKINAFNYLRFISNKPSIVMGNIEEIVRVNWDKARSFELRNHPFIIGRFEKFLDNICPTSENVTFSIAIFNCPNITWGGQNITGYLTGQVYITNGTWTSNLTLRQ